MNNSEIRHYLGNPRVKATGVKIQFTREQAIEYSKCRDSYLYFMKNYVKIVHPDHGLMYFDPFDYQEEIADTLENNRFVICKMARQSGKSTIVVAYLLWTILFHDHQSVAIIANKASTARKILSKLAKAYEELPFWIQQGAVSFNKGSIELENGSRILADATGGSTARGDSFNIVFLDEFAFVHNNIAKEFYASVFPTISSGKTTKVFIVSTPNGMNHFYKLWSDAVKGRSDYVPIEIHWSRVPGRDEEWKKQEIRNTSEEQFAQEHEVEFLGSTATLINPAILKTMVDLPPKLQVENFRIYEEPKAEHAYVMTVDVSEGLGMDYSAISIFDVSQKPYKQVAVYNQNKISHLVLPDIIHNFAKKYNNAYVLIELNNLGNEVARILQEDLEYEYIIMSEVRGRNGQVIVTNSTGNKVNFGVKMSPQVKRVGCSNLKSLIEQKVLVIQDIDTIMELSTFISTNNTYKAEPGMHDDIVMTNVLFGWLTSTQYFKDLVNSDLRVSMYGREAQRVEENTLPLGFFNDGYNDEMNNYYQAQLDKELNETNDDDPWVVVDVNTYGADRDDTDWF